MGIKEGKGRSLSSSVVPFLRLPLACFFPFPTSLQHKEASKDERGYFTVVSENLSRLSVVRKPNTDCLYKVVSNFIACVTRGKARVEGAIN